MGWAPAFFTASTSLHEVHAVRSSAKLARSAGVSIGGVVASR